MGSSAGAVLFYCVSLSVVAAAAVVSSTAAFELPPDVEPDRSISETALASSAATATTTSRKLMGADSAAPTCPVRFDQMKGYEALGAKCRNKATVKECCAAFKALACPYNKLLNDADNGCADEMFYFIQTKGKLKPGTIFENCLERPQGLKC
ncbi:GPI-anchored protein LLG1-like [Oryza brachyantha]|uniref:GPI-anchored protein LLG1-like n=1 Tax=Oryza brachyantha TaxID=4533 RepID=UPI0007764968|nr:GPI-anchored protein LLG1-like [Oryza brachyantha]